MSDFAAQTFTSFSFVRVKHDLQVSGYWWNSYQLHTFPLCLPNNNVECSKEKKYAAQSFRLNFLSQNWWTEEQACYFENTV